MMKEENKAYIILALLSKCPAWAEDYGVKLEFEIGGK